MIFFGLGVHFFWLSKRNETKNPPRRRQPRRCFSALSENIENLNKVVPSANRTGNAVSAFVDFLMFSDSRQYWPAVWACLRSATLAVRRGLRNYKRFD